MIADSGGAVQSGVSEKEYDNDSYKCGPFAQNRPLIGADGFTHFRMSQWVNERVSQAQISAKIESKDQGKDPLTMVIFCAIVSYSCN